MPFENLEKSIEMKSLPFKLIFSTMYPAELIITRSASSVFTENFTFRRFLHGLGNASKISNCELLAPAGSSPAEVQGWPKNIVLSSKR